MVSGILNDRKTNLKVLRLTYRQIKALEMMVNEGKVFSNKIYQETFDLERRTASRDLKKLVDLKQIIRSGMVEEQNIKQFRCNVLLIKKMSYLMSYSLYGKMTH